MRAVVVLLLLLSGAALVACGGQSAEQKAQDQVCGARTDIQKQVTTLQGLPLATSSVDKAKQGLTAIKRDLDTIKAALPDLSMQRKQQVTAATQTFQTQFAAIAKSFTSLPPAQLVTQAQAAFAQLAGAYKQALAPINC